MATVSMSFLSSQISELTSMVRNYGIGQAQQLQQAHTGFYGQPRHNPYLDTYNTSWGDNMSYGYSRTDHYHDYQRDLQYNPCWGDNPNYGYARADYYQNYQAQATPQNSHMELEEMVRKLEISGKILQQQVDQAVNSMNAHILRREEVP